MGEGRPLRAELALSTVTRIMARYETLSVVGMGGGGGGQGGPGPPNFSDRGAWPPQLG